MKLLAIDTSSTSCTVALKNGDDLLARYEEQEREHTRLLMPMIRDVIGEGGVSVANLDAIVLGNGPGSFIGMRIAASVAQGLAHGAGINIIPVSSLAAVAAQVMDESGAERVAVAQDAHMSEVYLGLFAKGSTGLPEAIAAERLQPQSEIAEFSAGDEWVAAGFGWQRYPELKAMNAGSIIESSSVLYPDARYLLQLSDAVEAVAPRDVQPAYLRQKVAEKPRKSGQ